ncbi:hypothetical protein RRG08_015042 [Elysia crispata]|uniref:Uncharacterized protein n=1 Tax=Elysia crispata TaxID=231223 RepID=A0AAE1B5Q3_9GAST|nr:hypothetical protein RRG08_015042 [Elysia crispata]
MNPTASSIVRRSSDSACHKETLLNVRTETVPGAFNLINPSLLCSLKRSSTSQTSFPISSRVYTKQKLKLKLYLNSCLCI